MKIKVAILTMVALFPFVTLRAADARVFEGVNLDELGQTQRLQEVPEIYERDPANGRQFRRRRAVLQVQLGAAWLYFNPERNASYLYVNPTPGRGNATYFGPMAGDAFETFKLEARFITKLRQDYADNVPNVVELMLRTDDAKLRECALRIMTAGLAPDIGANTRAYHVAKFKELAAILNGDDVAPLRAAIAQTERRIEELSVMIPDSDYQPGNDELARQGKLQDWMSPAVVVPASAWGGSQNGLRAAAVFSTTESKLGQEMSVWLLVGNISDKEIRFGSSDVMQDAHARVTRADGTNVELKSTWLTGMSPIQRHKLRPGERLTLAKKSLIFDDRNSTNAAGFGGNRVAAGPGEYSVRYESILTTGMAWERQDDGLMHRTLPAKGEWSGRLTTAETTIVIAGEPAAANAPGERAAAPAPRKGTGTKSILVNVLDATGKKPIREFHVIAGMRSMPSRERDNQIVNWQPHTLRIGTDGVLNWPLAEAYDPMALRVEADGYAPQVFAWLEKNKAHDVDFLLTADKGTAARVLMPDGKPASGATVALAMVQREAVIENGLLRRADDPLLRVVNGHLRRENEASDLWRRPRFVKADADGRFVLPSENDPTAAVLIMHGSGVREMTLAEFKKLSDVTLQPWGRIEGRAQWGDVLGTNRNVSLSIQRDSYGYPGVIAQYEKTTTGVDGSFSFERVLPGLVQLSCPTPATPGNKAGITEVNLPGMTTHLTVQPGKNSTLLSGQGRTVTGRLTGREAWADVTFRFHPTAPHFGREGDSEMWAAWSALQKSPVGPVFFRDGLEVKVDGTFEVLGVLPGDYQIFFTRAGEKEHVAAGKFTVPAETAGTKSEPQSIGELRSRSVP